MLNVKNPLKDEDLLASPEPCILVIYGASGDLTHKKLMPAIYNLSVDGQLQPNFVCVGFARRDKTNESFREEMKLCIEKFSRSDVHEYELALFLERLFYYNGDFQDSNAYSELDVYLKNLDAQFGTKGNRIFYLSVQPSSYLTIIENLTLHNLIYNKEDDRRFSRVIIEKPFGKDYDSAVYLKNQLLKSLREDQIYRIDHYLGKETVQNILIFRFSNPIFENIWNNNCIDNIQITVAETIGIEERGNFYEKAGLLRDIIQNHLMQLLSLITMEQPTSLDPNAIRDEKVKILESILPYNEEMIDKWTRRGQYKDGFIEGESVCGYRDENNVSSTSNVETFAAMRIEINNSRWHGMPIYIRAGKRLPKRCTEIAVTFKHNKNNLFTNKKGKNCNEPNSIIFRIQPNEGISIKFNSKTPRSSKILTPVNMDFQYDNYFGKEIPEAYERLIYDAMLGDTTLFARADESLYSWKLITPILNKWAFTTLKENEFYRAGTWGTKESDLLLENESRQWKRV